MEYWAAITVGLLGSFHCAGMCGPIAFALPVHKRSLAGKVTGIFLYNLGRVLTYAVLGGIFGLLGAGFVMGGFQQWVSIVLGALMVASVLLPALFHNKLNPTSRITRFVGWVKNQLRAALGHTSNTALFTIGLLNGLLPCGLVYLAVAGAIATGTVAGGSIYMALFGLGTVPMMWGIVAAGNLVSLSLRNNIRKVMPWAVAIIGLLFILRGMDLGIPYLSPEMASDAPTANCCHPE